MIVIKSMSDGRVLAVSHPTQSVIGTVAVKAAAPAVPVYFGRGLPRLNSHMRELPATGPIRVVMYE